MKLTLFAALAAAFITATACAGSESPTPSQVQPAAPGPASAGTAGAPSQLATPAVVLPTATITPTATPPPLPTAQPLGASAATQSTDAPTPESQNSDPQSTAQTVEQIQLVQGQPITWVNYRRWHRYWAPDQNPQLPDLSQPEHWDHANLATSTSELSADTPRIFVIFNHPDPQDREDALNFWRNAIYRTFIHSNYHDVNALRDVKDSIKAANVFRFTQELFDAVRHHIPGAQLCPPQHQDPSFDPSRACHRLNLHQVELLSEDPPVIRYTAMFTPVTERGNPFIQGDDLPRDHAEIYISAIYLFHGEPSLAWMPSEPPTLVSGPIIDYVAHDPIPIVYEPVPTTIPGVDPDDLDWFVYCGRHDFIAFEGIFRPYNVVYYLDIWDFLKTRRTYEDTEWTLSDLAAHAYQAISDRFCDDGCTAGYFETEDYQTRIADRLQTAITDMRHHVNPERGASGCPNVRRFPDLINP